MPYRILIIDDTEDLRAIAAMALELDAELDVRTCGSGREGLQIAEWWHPDLILLDVQMPEMSGPEALTILRQSAAAASTPVVFFTALAQRYDKPQHERLLALGAQGIISKPFDPLALASQVRPFLAPAPAQAGFGSEAPFPKDCKSLLYASRSCLAERDADTAVERIVDTAQAKNEHRDITGALIFTHTHFAQYLEGPGAAVDNLMETIRQDPRHTDVRIVPVPQFSRRFFSEWRMAYGGSSEYVSRLVDEVFDQADGSGVDRLVRLMRELSNKVEEERI